MPEASDEQRKLAAIMFTDMAGYSALAQQNETRAIELLEEHRRIVRSVLPRYGGREVKTTGDGFLIEFPSAVAAVEAAVEIQKAMHERNLAVARESQVNIRIGIHIGDVVPRQGDIHGDGVNIAARLEPLAAPGGICISSAVWELVHNKVNQPLALLGPAELKNIQLRVVVHRVVMPWESAASLAPSRPRSAIWLAGLAVLAVAAAFLMVPRSPRTRQLEPGGIILFQTGFEAPTSRVPRHSNGRTGLTKGEGEGVRNARAPGGEAQTLVRSIGMSVLDLRIAESGRVGTDVRLGMRTCPRRQHHTQLARRPCACNPKLSQGWFPRRSKRMETRACSLAYSRP
jgi:class 3 adenylate cyclase